MKRKVFTESVHLNTFGKWLYGELFNRNITIIELAKQLNITDASIRRWMQHRPLRTDQLLKICAVLADSKMEYHQLVFNAMREMPDYQQIYTTQKEVKQNAKH